MIRAYSDKDKNKAIALLQLNTPAYFHASEQQDYEAYLEHEVEDYFVFEDGTEIIGVGGINYFPEERTARISWDMIAPNHHGKGVGKQLLEHRINHVKENKAIDTIVVRTTQLAYRFYEKAGFILEETKKDYWADGFDLYLMKMTIDR